ncbi:chymotrypsinogen B2-like [Scyliorhinus torazame]|uniref:chymotrypsinogen B2-like n=1 Tax=Scyliorhinus torazame TaxID=75743 RepID=UPI003B5B7136
MTAKILQTLEIGNKNCRVFLEPGMSGKIFGEGTELTFRVKKCGERAFPPGAKGTPSDYKDRIRHSEGRENSKAELKEFPWQVILTHWRKHHCGGSLINEYWVVTTAQCVANSAPEDLQVLAGTVDIAHQENTHTVEKIISHEDYNPKALQNDIALLELAQPVNYNELAGPVCFPDATFMDPDHLGICWTTGWRQMHTGSQKWVRFLHKTRTRHISKAECKVAWGNRIDEDVICAKNTGPNNTGCPVEAGSPLICLSQRASRWVLMGILTMAPRDCQSAAVYTRLAHYIGWVKARTEATGKPFIPLIPAAPDLLQQEGSAWGSGLGA